MDSGNTTRPAESHRSPGHKGLDISKYYDYFWANHPEISKAFQLKDHLIVVIDTITLNYFLWDPYSLVERESNW